MRRLVAVAVVLLAFPASASAGRWLAGDLHIHTTYSHDSYGGPADDNTGLDEAYTLGNTVGEQFLVASTRGLDYLAISDHNDIRAWTDPGFGAHGVQPIHAYENSLDGHAQMLGAARLYPKLSDNYLITDLVSDLRGDGGLFQVNHPADGSVDFPHDIDWGYGYDVEPNTVEVWNISRLYQAPFPSGSSNDDAIRWWEGWLERGAKVGATGGSDNHYKATLGAQGPGQPTTWVYADSSTEAAILEGIRNGRTTISHQPPAYGGPRLFLEADADGDGTFEKMVGDEIPQDGTIRVRAENAAGQFVRLIGGSGDGSGGRQLSSPVPATPNFSQTVAVDEIGTEAPLKWVRAELFDEDLAEQRKVACDGLIGSGTTYCRNLLLVTAMTSPLYVAP